MRSSDVFGFFLLFLLDFWRPTEGLCNLENGTTATCDFLHEIHSFNTRNLVTLKTSIAENILNATSLHNLTALKHLDLSKGNLTEISPGTFLQLPQLRSLNLAENHISHLSSSSLEGLRNLRSVNLKKNNFQSIPEALLDLKKLKILDISRNHINCNCATLKIRDKLIARGVTISKKAVCSKPLGVIGRPLLKPTSELVCIFEEDDELMQKDQPVGEEVEELGSGEEEAFDDDETEFDEDIDAPPKIPEVAETPAPETPVPETTEAETPAPKPTEPATPPPKVSLPELTTKAIDPTVKTEETFTSAKPVEVSLEKTKLKGDDGLFFDSEEKSSTEAAPAPQTEKATSSFETTFPVEGSGDDDEFEGSGTIVPPIDFGKTKESKEETAFDRAKFDEDASSSGSLFDSIWGSWGDTPSTASPKEKISEIEKEEFMPVVTQKTSEVEGMMPKSFPSEPIKTEIGKTVVINNNESPTRDGETKQELADASSQDTKTGAGPMVVLIVLLGIFAALLGLAAYKGDFCRKKRVPDDVERGTELKEMRKSLLEGGNTVQPKLSNGNAENVPLIKVPLQADAPEKENLTRNGNGTVEGSVAEEPSPPGLEPLDPVKPPRKSTPHEDIKSPTNGKSHQNSCINPEKFKPTSLNFSQNDIKAPPNTPMNDFGSPPLSPDAQRVKIILQENPDSVPKTPILITRTKMGENLVKTP